MWKKNLVNYSLSSLVYCSTMSLKSSEAATFSARITSVIMYSTDKIMRKSTESANDTATFLIAIFVALEFLVTKLDSLTSDSMHNRFT